jgi:hypothetical protein
MSRIGAPWVLTPSVVARSLAGALRVRSTFSARAGALRGSASTAVLQQGMHAQSFNRLSARAPVAPPAGRPGALLPRTAAQVPLFPIRLALGGAG